jgi:hypothetical protein
MNSHVAMVIHFWRLTIIHQSWCYHKSGNIKKIQISYWSTFAIFHEIVTKHLPVINFFFFLQFDTEKTKLFTMLGYADEEENTLSYTLSTRVQTHTHTYTQIHTHKCMQHTHIRMNTNTSARMQTN